MKNSLQGFPTENLVVIVILKCQERFWIHQRRSDKRIYPGLWGIGIGGKVDPGETPLQAAVRELWEESGIRSEPGLLQSLGEYDWASTESSYHGFLYQVEVLPNAIIPCSREFQDHLWTDIQGIDGKNKSGQLCPDTRYFWEKNIIPLLSNPKE